MSEDLDRLNDSIGDLLDLSRLESDAWQPHFEMQDVRDILGTVRSRLSRETARSRLVRPRRGPAPSLRATSRSWRVRFTNLVENALAYSPPGSSVTVGAEQRGDALELWVEDRGPGVPNHEKTRVFDKFYRGEASASVPGGTGLGLAIAREIVRSHGGTHAG